MKGALLVNLGSPESPTVNVSNYVGVLFTMLLKKFYYRF